MKGKVSIIIPIYNNDEYIAACIESIINQDYKNIEIILVNDGSTDNSLDICKKYKKLDKRIKIINKKNCGVSAARNVGIERATGEYFVFVDGDDCLRSDYITYMVGLLNDNDCEFALSKNCFKSENESQVSEDRIEVLNSIDTTALLLSPRVDVGCWDKIYRRSIIENIRFDGNQFFGEGLQFITNVSQRAPYTAVGERKVYYYRQYPLSVTKKYKFNKYVNGEQSLKLIEKNLIIDDVKVRNQLYSHYCLFYYYAMTATLKNNAKKEHMTVYKMWKKKARKLYRYVVKNSLVTFKVKLKVFLLLYFTFIYTFKYKVLK